MAHGLGGYKCYATGAVAYLRLTDKAEMKSVPAMIVTAFQGEQGIGRNSSSATHRVTLGRDVENGLRPFDIFPSLAISLLRPKKES